MELTSKNYRKLITDSINNRHIHYQGLLDHKKRLLLYNTLEVFLKETSPSFLKAKRAFNIAITFIDLLETSKELSASQLFDYQEFTVSLVQNTYLFNCSFISSLKEITQIITKINVVNRLDIGGKFELKRHLLRKDKVNTPDLAYLIIAQRISPSYLLAYHQVVEVGTGNGRITLFAQFTFENQPNINI